MEAEPSGYITLPKSLLSCPLESGFVTKIATGSGELTTARGPGVPFIDSVPCYIIGCSGNKIRCDRCPRFHAIRKYAVGKIKQCDSFITCGNSETNLGDRDRKVTVIFH